MSLLNRTGLDRRFVFFALLSVVLAALIIPLFGFVASALMGVGGAPEDNPVSEMASVYLITVALGVTMTLFALPVTLPASVGLWIASHWVLFDLYSEIWRIRIAAAVSGLAGCAGFIFWFSAFNDQVMSLSFVLVLMPGVVIAALVSAEIVYRSARRELA